MRISLAVTTALLGLFCLRVESSQAESKSARQKCESLLERGMSSADVFILQIANRIRNYGKLPQANTATYRLISLNGGRDAFDDVLKKYKVTYQQWRDCEDIALDANAVLGTRAFVDTLDKVRVRPRVKLSNEQRDFFVRLNEAADQAREKVKAFLITLEEDSLKNQSRFLTEEELTGQLRAYTQGSKNELAQFVSLPEGGDLLEEWRYRVLTERSKLASSLRKDLAKALKDAVMVAREIPESTDEILRMTASALQIPVESARQFFGTRRLFDSFDAFVRFTSETYADALAGVIDRRVFTKARTDAMLKAIRDANEIIFFKLAENQDIGNWAEIEILAEHLNAPIIVAPAFSEVNMIISRLGFLMNHPRVHIMVDQELAITKDFYVVNNGASDKAMTPETGLEQVFEPTDRVLIFHPRVRTTPRASGYYATQASYFMTTGSMSKPAYRSEWNMGMSTDFRAQREAEVNRGLTVLSRRYRNETLGHLTGAANGLAPRRVLYTDAEYGNPAGLYDMNRIYTANGVHHLSLIPGLILGDIHLGVTDPAFQRAFFRSLVRLGILKQNPRADEPGQFEYVAGDVKLGALILHDLVEGTPFNHHVMDRIISKAHLDANSYLDIESHFKFAAWFVTFMRKLLPETQIIVPVDNHGHDWLVNALQDATRGQRPRDLPMMLRLMLDTVKGANPYEKILRYFGIDHEGVTFMSNNQQYRLGIDLKNPKPFSVLHGFEVGQHTHQGISGSRSISINGLLGAYQAVVGGHTHATSERSRAKRVGAGIPIPSDYHKGPGRTDASLALGYSDTAVQVLRMINNTFVPNVDGQAAAEFFPSDEFPNLRPWPELPEGGNVTDQFRRAPPVARFRR